MRGRLFKLGRSLIFFANRRGANSKGPFFKDYGIPEITGKLAGEAKKTPECKWTKRGGIEIHCIYMFVGNKHNKLKVSSAHKKIES